MRAVLDYVLDDLVGQGDATCVHRARRLPGHEVFALKTARADLDEPSRRAAQDRLRREADVLATVSHPALIELVEVLEVPRLPSLLRPRPSSAPAAAPPSTSDLALVLRWARLGALTDVAARAPLASATAIELGTQIAAALAALHDAGLVHGDVSPGNVLQADVHRWWLADLGEAHGRDLGPRPRRRGTEGFVAPEVLDGAGPDRRADVFAFGQVLAAALGAGRGSSGERSPLRWTAPSDLDGRADLAELSRLIEQATDLDPEARPTAATLAECLSGLSGLSGPATPRFVDARVAIRPGTVTRDLVVPQVATAPAPPAGPPRVSSTVRLGVAVAGAAALLLVLAFVALRVGWPRSATASDRAVDQLAAGSSDLAVDRAVDQPGTADRPPCPGSDGAAPAGATVVPGDVDGVGCTVGLTWWPDRAVVERPEPNGARRRFALGRPGDQLLLGDWDGDGVDTAALYDPAAGTVTRFDGWAGSGEPLRGTLVRSDAPLAGIARVRPVDGLDQVDVDPSPP